MRRNFKALLPLLFCAQAAYAQQGPVKFPPPEMTDVWRQIKIGDIEVRSPISGITTAQDVFDVLAPFDGRVEELQVELFNLAPLKKPLARMVSNEMAALLDSTPESGRKEVEKRWSSLYKYHDILPEFEGVVTNIYVEPRTQVTKGDRLFTLAKRVVVVGRNTKPLYSVIANDMIGEVQHFRTAEKYGAKLINFLKIKDRRYFYRLWLEITQLREGLRIGEQFEGELYVGKSANTRLVPRKQIFETGGRKYLVMEVETGLITEEEAEILRPGNTYLETKLPPEPAAEAPKEETAGEEPAAAPPQKTRVVKKSKETQNARTRKTR